MAAPEPAPEPPGLPGPAAPLPRFTLKAREFTVVNAMIGPEEKSAHHDVYEILKQVRASEAAAGIGELAPAPPPKNRRRRDYLLLLIGGNGLMLALFMVEIFIGFQVQCLAARMPGELNHLLRYAVTDGRPMFLLPAFCMTGYTTGLSYLMYGVMGKY